MLGSIPKDANAFLGLLKVIVNHDLSMTCLVLQIWDLSQIDEKLVSKF